MSFWYVSHFAQTPSYRLHDLANFCRITLPCSINLYPNLRGAFHNITVLRAQGFTVPDLQGLGFN